MSKQHAEMAKDKEYHRTLFGMREATPKSGRMYAKRNAGLMGAKKHRLMLFKPFEDGK